VLKRIFDVFIATLMLFVFLPIIIMLMIISLIVFRKAIFFRQERPGLYGIAFTMYKFRTMSDGRDEKGELLPDNLRLNRYGRFLRSSSLDELPELWNVLKGEMSLVGPRPLLMEYLPLYSQLQARRHEVRPGITGWAQINGRNAISWEEKFNFDVWYVDNQSLWLDIKILLLTIKKVFAKEGVNADSNLTMEKFTGNE